MHATIGLDWSCVAVPFGCRGSRPFSANHRALTARTKQAIAGAGGFFGDRQTAWPGAADEKPNQLNSTTLGWNRNSVRSAAAASDAAKRKRFIVVGVGSEPSSAFSALFPSSSVRGGDCELNRRRSKNGIKILRLDTACFT